jgi:hypothetical protein
MADEDRIVRNEAENKPHHFPAGWVFSLAASVVVTAIVIAAVIILRKDDITSSQFRLGITLITFALSVVSGVIFAPHARFQGTIGVLSVYVAGPAALWLVSMVSFKYLFPQDPGPAFPNQIAALTSLVSDIQHKEGWITLKEWKTNLGPLEQLFRGKDEEPNMRQLLSGAYINGAPRIRPQSPIVQTLFFYPGPTQDPKCLKPSIKLQRITARDALDLPWLFAIATNTVASGTTNLALFTKDGDRITSIRSSTENWFQITTKTFDAILVARYCNGQLSEGDWLQIHVPKYLGGGAATVDFGLASLRKIVDPHAWEMRASAFSSREEPIVFRPIAQVPATDVKKLLVDLGPWLEVLRSAAKNDGGVWEKFPEAGVPVRELVRFVMNEIDGGSGASPYFGRKDLSTMSYHLDGMENAVIVDFEWDDQIR